MAAPRMTSDDNGEFFLGPDGSSVWRMVAYCGEPTATLELVHPAEALADQRRRVSGAVGAPIFDGYQRLVAGGKLASRADLERVHDAIRDYVPRERYDEVMAAYERLLEVYT